MRATVRRDGGDAVELRIEGVRNGDATGPLADSTGAEPSPEELLAASLASCTATTMELYARRKGWELGEVEVDAAYSPAQRGSPTRCTIHVRLPEDLGPERRERLMQIGATSRVHRILEGEVLFEESVEVVPRTAERGGVSEPPRRHIALLNGLRGALPKRPV